MVTITHAWKVENNDANRKEMLTKYIGWSFSSLSQYETVKDQLIKHEGFTIDFRYTHDETD